MRLLATNLGLLSLLPLTKVAGKPIANFLGPPYCQRGDVYPSILTESRPAGLVMAGYRFLNQC